MSQHSDCLIISSKKHRNRKGFCVLVGMTGFVTFALAGSNKGERLKFALRLAKSKGAFAIVKTAKFLPRQRHLIAFLYRDSLGSRFFTTSFRQKNPIRTARAQIGFLVGMTGFEPATSCSQSKRATNCATSRCFFI